MGDLVREKTLSEEISSLNIEDSVKERILKKYWNEVDRHRAEVERIRAESHNKEISVKREIEDKNTIISVLAGHIRSNELL